MISSFTKACAGTGLLCFQWSVYLSFCQEANDACNMPPFTLLSLLVASNGVFAGLVGVTLTSETVSCEYTSPT